MSIIAKSIVWVGDIRKRIREFPDKVRGKAGFELWEVQQGDDPSDWKLIPSVGLGVREIRNHAEGEFRVIYVVKFEDVVYVLHALHKKRGAHRHGTLNLHAAGIECC